MRPEEEIITAGKKLLIEGNENKLSIPLKVVGSDQVVPVLFKLESSFTTTSFSLSPDKLDFGTVFRSIGKRIKVLITNNSLLPQKISFIRLPKEISITPSNGCLTFLPKEQISVYFYYKYSIQNYCEERGYFVSKKELILI